MSILCLGEQYDEILIALGGLRLGENFEVEIEPELYFRLQSVPRSKHAVSPL